MAYIALKTKTFQHCCHCCSYLYRILVLSFICYIQRRENNVGATMEHAYLMSLPITFIDALNCLISRKTNLWT